MSNSNFRKGIDVEKIEALAERQRGGRRYSGKCGPADNIPRGTYTGLVVQVEQRRNHWGDDVTQAVLEVANGSYAGQRVSVITRGFRAELLRKAAETGRQVQFDVFLRRLDNGSEVSTVNRETVCWIDESPAQDGPGLPAHVREMMNPEQGDHCRTRAPFFESTISTLHGGPSQMVFPPTLEQMAAAAAEYQHGFACIGSKKAGRQIVNWLDFHESMERGTSSHSNQPCLLSMFSFSKDFPEYVANHGTPGSTAGYRGSAYSPLLVFDIDRMDASGQASLEVAYQDAVSLLVVLLELGVPHDLIRVYFSGCKGYHVSFPSTLAGAMPSENFPDVAKVFCLMIAAEAGIEIDKSLYRVLQPLRATNSRHEKSELFKTCLTADEFLKSKTTEIKKLAEGPRPVVPVPLMHEPIQALAELWFSAEQMGSRSAPGYERQSAFVGNDDRIFAATWEFLINGAPDGERAVSLFRAAANLADFGSRDELIRALLDRATTLCGLPPSEAWTHIESALRRAGEGSPE